MKKSPATLFFILMLFACTEHRVSDYRTADQQKLAEIFVQTRQKLEAEKDAAKKKIVLKSGEARVDSLLGHQGLLFSNQVSVVDDIRNAFGGITVVFRFDLHTDYVGQPRDRTKAIFYIDNMSNYSQRFALLEKIRPTDTVIISGEYQLDEVRLSTFNGGMEGGYPEFSIRISDIQKKK